MDKHHTVRLPMERKIQLDAIAEVVGTTSFSATLATLIDLAREQGLVSHGIPGVTLNAFPDGLSIVFDEMPPVAMSPKGAAMMAQTIRAVVDGTEGAGAVVNLDHCFTVKRRGSGVRVALHADGKEPTKTWSPDLASEFADLIDHALATN